LFNQLSWVKQIFKDSNRILLPIIVNH
jgi:hypothetical protein